jgi:hypothetical protein
VLITVGGERRCDAFYATCSIEFTDEFFPASAENTKSYVMRSHSFKGLAPNCTPALATAEKWSGLRYGSRPPRTC